MIDYIFKTYIADGQEHFVYGEREIGSNTVAAKSFPFPESLLRLLYLDIWKYEPLTKRIDRSLRELYQTRDERFAQEIVAALDELAEAHIYFEFLRLDWRYRLEESRIHHYANAADLLPHKKISHIPSTVDLMQKQIKALIAKALDIDGEKKSVSEKMVEYYNAAGADTLHTFQFQPQPMNFEVIDHKTFAEVLHPETIYDLIAFSVRECVKRETRMRVCKNCGHWFAVTGRTNTEYCSLTLDAKGRTCREIGAIQTWTKNKVSDSVFKDYRREYKRRFAWIKAGRIEPSEFYTWSAEAREKKAECENGRSTLEEFSEWLRLS